MFVIAKQTPTPPKTPTPPEAAKQFTPNFDGSENAAPRRAMLLDLTLFGTSNCGSGSI
jgi:hypothetical protein